jgi:signal transduction histidine kinase
VSATTPATWASAVAAASWSESVADHPARAVAALVVVVVGTVGVGVGLRSAGRRMRSLRAHVLLVALASLALGALIAALLAWVMVLEGRELGQVAVVLALTTAVAAVLVVLASQPLGTDAHRLEAMIRRIDAGDRTVRSEVDRADELGHVATALDELTERLGRLEAERVGLEEERAAMLSSVGHDLRTPLAALRVAVEALADGVAPDPDRYYRSMQRDVAALSALVDDLFLLTRLESGRVDLTPDTVDLTEIADEAIEALAPVAAEHRVQVRLAADGRVRAQGDPLALGRVIRNLLDNAICHAPAGTAVEVAVGAGGTARVRRAEGTARVRVVDEGPGFDVAFAPHAFDRFSRADASRARETGGTGLGLAIARGLVEAQGGRIWIEPPPGGRVAFEVPAA